MNASSISEMDVPKTATSTVLPNVAASIGSHDTLVEQVLGAGKDREMNYTKMHR